MIHRLDICTTGVVLTTTDKNSASYFQSLIQKRGVTKIYIAQVKGLFPDHTLIKCESKIDGKDSFTQFLRVDVQSIHPRQDRQAWLFAFPKLVVGIKFVSI